MLCRADWRTRARIRIEPWDDFHFLDIQEQSRCEINILLMAYIAEMLPVCCCYTTDYSNAACLLLVDYRYLPSGDPMVKNIRHKKADTCLIFSYIQGQSRIASAATIPVYHEQNLEQTFK